MKKGLWAGFLTAAAALLWSPAVLAHGGQYRGPGDTVPPNLGGPGDTTPPGNPGGPGTPGPGAPTTGGARGPATGNVPNAPGTAGGTGPARPTTGGMSRRSSSEGFERWEFWWEHNKEPFLNLRSKLAGGDVTTDSGGFLVGRGSIEAAATSNRPNATDVRTKIFPALERGLAEDHPDIVDSSALGIGRTVRADEATAALGKLTATLGHSAKTGREAATLALGVLGSADAVPTLLELLNDTTEGRRLTGQSGGVENLVRAFSAAALGLIGDAGAVEPLMAVINDRAITSNDVKSMAILALGLMKEGHDQIVPYLSGLMTNRDLQRAVRAQAPIALGRLQALNGPSEAARATLADCVAMFRDDKTDIDLLRSLAICIGELATVADGPAIDALFEAARENKDDQTRHYSIMALAQLGAADDEPQAHAEAHKKLHEYFLGELTKPDKQTHRPYGALGLAVYSTNDKLGIKADSGAKLLEQFSRNNNPSHQGAMAVGLGLVNYELATEALWAKFDDSNDQDLKGYIALALGLLNDKAHAEQFRQLVQRKGLEFKFKLQLSRALGLMGDSAAVQTLVSYLESAETLNESASSAQALGLIGDRSAIDPLISIFEAGSSDQARGFAAVALGILAEKKDLPWNVVFSVNSNYRAKTDALSEILDIL